MAVEKHMESSAFGHVKGLDLCHEEVTPNPGLVDGLEVGGLKVEPEGWGMGALSLGTRTVLSLEDLASQPSGHSGEGPSVFHRR